MRLRSVDTLLRRTACSMAHKYKVLFCSQDFKGGFLYTKEALRTETDVEVVQCQREAVAQSIADADVALPLGTKLTREVLDQAKKLKMIIQFGVGVEVVDIPAATEKRIWVSNIPSVGTGNALSCAEMAIYLALACLRNQKGMAQSLEQGSVGWPLGQTLFGKTVLVVGFGNIARELVPRLKAFDVELMAVRRSPWDRDGIAEEAAAAQLLDARGQWADLPAMLLKADVVVLTCVLTDETRGMVNEAFLKNCKPGVTIVNVARGGLLEYDSVKAGLESGAIGSLGLDVQWWEPFDPTDYFATHPRVVLTPHVAGVTELSYRTMADIVAREVRMVKQGLAPTVQLNSRGSVFEYRTQ